MTKLEQEKKAIEPQVQASLDELLHLLNQSEIIQSYKEIEARISGHEGLHELTEAIKVKQKEAVKFAHYGKPEAEKHAIKEADALTAQFDEHPLVIRYRQKLIEANDLLQHVTNLLEEKINVQLDLSYQDLLKNPTEEE